MKKKTLLVLGIFGLLAVVGGVALAWPKNTEPQFETALAQKGTVTQTVDLTGNLAYPETRRVSFVMSGEVDAMRVNVGETVKEGQLLATLRDVSGATQLSDMQKGMLRLTSPIAGVVTAIAAYPGEVVSAGMPVVTIAGPATTFEVVVSASENDVAKLTEGDAATITVEAIDEVFVGTVEHIAPVAQSAQGVVTYAVVVSVDTAINAGKSVWSGMRAGMTADVTVVTAETEGAVYVPRRAVITKDGKEYVRVIDSSEAGYVEREVTTGLRSESGNVVITSGVEEGEEVVTKIVE